MLAHARSLIRRQHSIARRSFCGTQSVQQKDPAYDYDLFVIGAGSGGVRCSRMSAAKGAKVAVAEPQYMHGPPGYTALGGTCVNVGCVPKKLFVFGSHYTHDFEDARGYGWGFPSDQVTVDWATLIDNKNKEIARLNGIYTRMLENAGVDVIQGLGTIVDPHTVDVGGQQYSAKNILVAVGGWPFMPPIPGIEHAISSNEAFYLPELPKRVLVVGGGYIAVEFAGIFTGYGSDVTLMYRGDLFLRGFDMDLREHLRDQLEAQGMKMQFQANPSAIEKQADGSLLVTMESGETMEVDCVMYATGRTPKTEGLGLEEAGVELAEDGSIVVDAQSQTTTPSIWAIGDVTNRMCLTPVALHEGMCLTSLLFDDGIQAQKQAGTLAAADPRVTPDFGNVASAVFSDPPIATVGPTEEEAVAQCDSDSEIVVFREEFNPMKHTLSGRQGQRCLVKLLVDRKSDKVIAAHMCGADAAEIMQGIAIAIKAGCTKADFDVTIGIHPSTAEEFVTMRTPTRVAK